MKHELSQVQEKILNSTEWKVEQVELQYDDEHFIIRNLESGKVLTAVSANILKMESKFLFFYNNFSAN